MRKHVFWRRLVSITLLAVLVGGVIGLVERQSVFEWWRLHTYIAPTNIAQLADETTMNDSARRIFYVNHPAVDSKSDFNGNCPNNTEKTIVLGCYHSNQQGIFVLQVTDARLDGVEQVTAAHEMLHAAYDRLSDSDKNYVNGLLEDYYKHDLHDQRIKNTIEAYEKSEPHDVVNEMHSIFGTEVTDLPAPLETYYERYFTNRKKVAAYAAQYQQAFTSRQRLVRQYDASLASMKRQITSDQAELDRQRRVIDAARRKLDAYRATGDYSAYNAGVNSYNAKVDAYNSLAATTRTLIAQYNQLVQKRNAVALEENQLVNAIDSTVQTIQQ